MAYRELTMTDIKEVLRRHQAGQGRRQIARESGLDRKTVRRYLKAAEACGVCADSELTDEVLGAVARQVQDRAAVEPSEPRAVLVEHRDRIDTWLKGSAEHRPLRLKKVHDLLRRRGTEVSYSTLRRFAIKEFDWRKRPVTVRLDDPPPAQEAQVDFGKMGMMVDPDTGKRRTLWALIVTLSYSRHQFVWPTFVQTTEAVCEGLDAAWRFFGGMVHRIVPDNLKPVVDKADAMSPVFNQAFTEYVQARGLFLDPARVRHPKDKGRVENQVPYVRESWFDGETFGSFDDAQRSALLWCIQVAGERIHGTTRKVPREVYEAEERPHMLAAPTEPFDVPRWTEAKVHPDHHIQVARALYSVPTRYIGEHVRVRCDKRTVRIYLRHELIKVHPRMAPGKRATDQEDYPKEKQAYAFRSVDQLSEQAYKSGEHVGIFADRLLEGPVPWTRMRAAYGLLRLCQKYGAPRVDTVCKRALAFDVLDVRRLERMLKAAHHSEQQATEGGKLVQLPLPDGRFARSADSFLTRRANQLHDHEDGEK